MAIAKLQACEDGNGGLEVVVTSWAKPTVVYELDWTVMGDICDECMVDGAGEPDYALVTEMVRERLTEEFNIPAHQQHDLTRAVRVQCEPGPGFTGDYTFQI